MKNVLINARVIRRSQSHINIQTHTKKRNLRNPSTFISIQRAIKTTKAQTSPKQITPGLEQKAILIGSPPSAQRAYKSSAHNPRPHGSYYIFRPIKSYTHFSARLKKTPTPRTNRPIGNDKKKSRLLYDGRVYALFSLSTSPYL